MVGPRFTSPGRPVHRLHGDISRYLPVPETCPAVPFRVSLHPPPPVPSSPCHAHFLLTPFPWCWRHHHGCILPVRPTVHVFHRRDLYLVVRMPPRASHFLCPPPPFLSLFSLPIALPSVASSRSRGVGDITTRFSPLHYLILSAFLVAVSSFAVLAVSWMLLSLGPLSRWFFFLRALCLCLAVVGPVKLLASLAARILHCLFSSQALPHVSLVSAVLIGFVLPGPTLVLANHGCFRLPIPLSTACWVPCFFSGFFFPLAGCPPVPPPRPMPCLGAPLGGVRPPHRGFSFYFCFVMKSGREQKNPILSKNAATRVSFLLPSFLPSSAVCT